MTQCLIGGVRSDLSRIGSAHCHSMRGARSHKGIVDHDRQAVSGSDPSPVRLNHHRPSCAVQSGPAGGPSHATKQSKMPVLDTTEPGQLLDSIDVRTPIGHRDRHRQPRALRYHRVDTRAGCSTSGVVTYASNGVPRSPIQEVARRNGSDHPAASDLANVRACSANRSAMGLSVRFLSVISIVGIVQVGSSIGSTLIHS